MWVEKSVVFGWMKIVRVEVRREEARKATAEFSCFVPAVSNLSTKHYFKLGCCCSTLYYTE